MHLAWKYTTAPHLTHTYTIRLLFLFYKHTVKWMDGFHSPTVPTTPFGRSTEAHVQKQILCQNKISLDYHFVKYLVLFKHLYWTFISLTNVISTYTFLHCLLIIIKHIKNCLIIRIFCYSTHISNWRIQLQPYILIIFASSVKLFFYVLIVVH
jgi:hypothetical protein